ncbi:MAG: Fic family protein [Deltaproteobacteria bacterium]
MERDSTFCYPEHIGAEMTRVFAWLKQQHLLRGQSLPDFAHNAAHFLAELNANHPFREGNGRTQLIFLALLADQAGHPLDLDKLNPRATLIAMIKSFKGTEKPLAALISHLVS